MRYDVLTQDLWALPICFTRCIGSLLRASTTKIFLFATVICVSTWDFTKVAGKFTKKHPRLLLAARQAFYSISLLLWSAVTFPTQRVDELRRCRAPKSYVERGRGLWRSWKSKWMLPGRMDECGWYLWNFDLNLMPHATCCKKFIRCRWWSGEIESIWRLCNWVSMLRGIDPSLVCSQCVKVFTGTSIWFLCFISSGSYRFIRLIGYPTTGCNINSNSQAASGGAYEDAGIAALNLRLFHRLVSSTRGIFFSQGACAPWNARCGTVPFTLCGWGGGVSTSKVSTAVLTQNSSRIFGDFRCTWASVQIPELRACAKSWIFFLEDWCQCHSGPGCSEQMHLSCCYVGARIQTMLKLLLTRSLGKFYHNFHAFCQSQSKSMPVSSI